MKIDHKSGLKFLSLFLVLIGLLCLSTVLTGQAAERPGQAAESRWTVVRAGLASTPEPVANKVLQIARSQFPNPSIVDSGVITVNQTIPDGDPQGITSTFTVAEDFTLDEVEVLWNIDHTNREELEIVLTSPTGTRYIMPPLKGSAVGDAGFQISIFSYEGESSRGEWSLTVKDYQASNVGALNSWQLILQAKVEAQVFLPLIINPQPPPTPNPSITPPLPDQSFLAYVIERPIIGFVGDWTFYEAGVISPTEVTYPATVDTAINETNGPLEVMTCVWVELTSGVITYMESRPAEECGVPPPTATKELLPTATPTLIATLLPGGAFNAGDPELWETYSYQEQRIYYNPEIEPIPLPVEAIEEWAAWLGGDNHEIAYIQKTIDIGTPPPTHVPQSGVPTPTPHPFDREILELTFLYWTQSYDSVCASSLTGDRETLAYFFLEVSEKKDPQITERLGADLGGIIIFDNTTGDVWVGVNDLCQDPESSLSLSPIDMAQFRGHNITIRIQAITDGQLESSVLVDHVQFWGRGGDLVRTSSSSLTLFGDWLDPAKISAAEVVPMTLIKNPSSPDIWFQSYGSRPKDPYLLPDSSQEMFHKER